MKTKDSINLEEYNITVNSNLPFTESNPYSFALERISEKEVVKNKRNDNLQPYNQDDVIQEKEDGSIEAFNTQ